MIDNIPQPEYVNFDTLSVLEMQDDGLCNNSVLSSQFDISENLDSSMRTPKLSMDTQTTKTGLSKLKTSNNIKRDEFDYNSYIKEELQKLKAEDLDAQTRKRLIQKIRNRMSAQRSRNRSKMVMNQLQDENQYLKLHNNELIQKLNILKEENNFLREQLRDHHGNDRSYSTDDQENNKLTTIPRTIRISRPQTVSLLKNMLMISAVVLAVTVGNNNTPESVKLGGIVPLLTTETNKSVKHLQSMENICKAYCLKQHLCEKEKPEETAKQVRLLADITKDVQVYMGPSGKDKLVPLMCFEDKDDKEQHIFLFKESSLQVMRDGNRLLYAPELVIVKPEIGFINN